MTCVQIDMESARHQGIKQYIGDIWPPQQNSPAKQAIPVIGGIVVERSQKAFKKEKAPEPLHRPVKTYKYDGSLPKVLQTYAPTKVQKIERKEKLSEVFKNDDIQKEISEIPRRISLFKQI